MGDRANSVIRSTTVCTCADSLELRQAAGAAALLVAATRRLKKACSDGLDISPLGLCCVLLI
jgi:hypothetical protein